MARLKLAARNERGASSQLARAAKKSLQFAQNLTKIAAALSNVLTKPPATAGNLWPATGIVPSTGGTAEVCQEHENGYTTMKMLTLLTATVLAGCAAGAADEPAADQATPQRTFQQWSDAWQALDAKQARSLYHAPDKASAARADAEVENMVALQAISKFYSAGCGKYGEQAFRQAIGELAILPPFIEPLINPLRKAEWFEFHVEGDQATATAPLPDNPVIPRDPTVDAAESVIHLKKLDGRWCLLPNKDDPDPQDPSMKQFSAFAAIALPVIERSPTLADYQKNVKPQFEKLMNELE